MVEYADEFEPEFFSLPQQVQDEILAHALLLQRFGPNLGRPRVDTLKGSKHANMKELRIVALGSQWRIAFAFDPRRQAVLLVAGNKSGKPSGRFYRRLLQMADSRFDRHINELAIKRKKNDGKHR